MPNHAPSSHSLLALTLLGGLAVAGASGACGDGSDPAATTSGTGGSGGMGQGGQAVGGIMTGPTGSGGAQAGGGGEGGTGEVGNVWGTVLGGDGSIFPKSVAIDGSGNIVVVGAFAGGSIDFGGGPLNNSGGDDIFIVKLAGDGSHIWSLAVGAGDDQGALAVAVDGNDNILIGGTFRGTFSFPGGPGLNAAGNQFSDAFLAKLDPSGGHILSAAYGVGDPNGDAGNGVATDAVGNLLFTGRFQGSIDFGGGLLGQAPGDFGMFLSKFSDQGAHSFSQAYGDSARQEGLGVAASPAGNVAVCGYSEGDVTFGGGQLINDGTTGRAVFARLDGDGNHVHSAIGVGGEGRATGVTFSGEDMVVAGNFKSAIDFGDGELEADGGNDDVFVTRFDDTGEMVFHRRFGDAGKDQVAGVAADGAGFVVIAGTFDGNLKVNFEDTLTSAASVQDAFLMRLGPSGNGFAGVTMQADTNAQAEGVAIDPADDSMVVIGRVTGNVDFGSGPLNGSADLFIAKFSP
jgi:hypothetical protein